ncbi:hypothetical protein [Desulfosarcina sp.]
MQDWLTPSASQVTLAGTGGATPQPLKAKAGRWLTTYKGRRVQLVDEMVA